LWNGIAVVYASLLVQKLLLKSREPIEGVQRRHGKEIHLPDLLKHGVGRRECGVQDKRLLSIDH
jgi:hypothetical protein